ncbi:hypothetical protein MXC99_09555 [Thauera aromatica]|uniref:hypothetical protein n=1 Tax=Thauera aromatica TaxID=59405 RepID=UPI001FFD65EA|nr:hypothetical protein [Thauera aromatica]MCK2088417.1 hypothetical protein [Thauera aromatica]
MSDNAMKQPVAGSIGAAITIGLSLVISIGFEPRFFGSWVAFLAMSIVPTQIIIGLVWNNRYPGVLARLGQPARGIAILGLLVAAGSVIAPATLVLVGGGITPPTPFLNMYIILSIVATFWLVAVFQCWPSSAISSHPAALGLGTLMLSYLSAWVVFQSGFDFGAMKGAPFYHEHLDPRGAFPAWNILSYAITTVAVIMGLVLLEFWPIAAIVSRKPAFSAQPYFGLIATAIVLSVAGVVWAAGVGLSGMDTVDYLVRIPVSFIFGTFILLTLFQTAPFQKLAQPAKGCALIVGSALLALLTYGLYRFVSINAFGNIQAGPPAYDLDLWIATAMLSITFPLIVAYAEGFAFWPLKNDGDSH